MPVPNFFLYARRETEIVELFGVIDGFDTEEHRLSLETTEVPVEDGSPLTDNVVKRPDELRLTGVTSDVFLPEGVQFNGNLGDRSTVAWQTIRELMISRELVNVVSHLHEYRNMIIRNCTAPVDVSTGAALVFSMDIKEILFADTELTRFDPQTVSGPAVDRAVEVDGGERISESIQASNNNAALDSIYRTIVGT